MVSQVHVNSSLIVVVVAKRVEDLELAVPGHDVN